MMQVLEGLAFEHREHPSELATVLAAFARLGFPPLNWDMGMGYGGTSSVARGEAEAWGLGRCHDVARSAMRGRRRSVLTARADGLLLGLESVAQEVMDKRLHDLQAGEYVIECRPLSVEDRLQRYRQENDERNAKYLDPMAVQRESDRS